MQSDMRTIMRITHCLARVFPQGLFPTLAWEIQNGAGKGGKFEMDSVLWWWWRGGRAPKSPSVFQKAVSGVVCPLWLKDMYRPISASHMKQVSAKLHGKDSSDEGEIFTKHAG